jgi:hypothetical protein
MELTASWLKRLQEAGHALCADAYVVAEAHRNLSGRWPDALDTFDRLPGHVEVAPLQLSNPDPEITKVLPDKDRPVLDAAATLAVRGPCDWRSHSLWAPVRQVDSWGDHLLSAHEEALRPLVLAQFYRSFPVMSSPAERISACIVGTPA